MAGIDEVLERLVTDGEFRATLARDPAAALASYNLTREDIELLASRLDDGDDAERSVEQRTSKSAMFALLTSLAGAGGGGTAGPGHEDQIEVLSWSWGETQGHDPAPDDLAVPDDAADELYNKSRGKVEYSWKVEEGVKAELDPDALTAEDGSGTAAPGVPSTDDEGIIVINGLEGDDEPLDPGLTGAGDEPEEAAELYLKLGDIKGEAQEPAATLPGDDLTDLGGVKAEVDPDALTHKVDPGGAEADADALTHEVDPGDEGAAGVVPPDDDVVGGNPPDDTVVGANPPDDNLGVRTDVTAAMDVDDVMEIGDV